MDAHSIGILIVAGGALAALVWLLHKLGKALVAIAEVVAAAAVVFVTLWGLIKILAWLATQVVIHPRTTAAVIVVAAWWYWLGWPSLAITVGALGLLLVAWRLWDLPSFDHWAGRWLRAWWLRWSLYAPNLPKWLHACGLSIKDDTVPVTVTVNLVGRKKVSRDQQRAAAQIPKVVRVASGPSWDEVRVRLMPGQKPEDFDEAARALASARKVARCQVREVAPNVVSIDFQRRNLLAAAVPCANLTTLGDARGESINLSRVWTGRTEYGQDWCAVGRSGKPHVERGCLGCGEELGHVVAAGVHRPGHPGRPCPGIRH